MYCTVTINPPSEKDDEYIPDEVNISDDAIDISLQEGESLVNLVNATPIKFQLKRNLELIVKTQKCEPEEN